MGIIGKLIGGNEEWGTYIVFSRLHMHVHDYNITFITVVYLCTLFHIRCTDP